MKKEQKERSINLAKGIFADNSVVILLNYKKLNAKNMYSLRKSLKSKNANLKKTVFFYYFLFDFNRKNVYNLKIITINLFLHENIY